MDVYVTPRIITIPPSLVDSYALRFQEQYDARKGKPREIFQLDEDVWGVYGGVDQHTDGIGDERVGFVVQGLILSAGFECELVTESHHLPLTAGCVYRLRPTIPHGVNVLSRWQTPLLFLAWDHPEEHEMTPHEFARVAMEDLMRRSNRQ